MSTLTRPQLTDTRLDQQQQRLALASPRGGDRSIRSLRLSRVLCSANLVFYTSIKSIDLPQHFLLLRYTLFKTGIL